MKSPDEIVCGIGSRHGGGTSIDVPKGSVVQSITVAMDKSRVNANATRLKPRSMPPSTSECRIPILSITGPVSRENLMGRRELACKYVVRVVLSSLLNLFDKPHNTPLLCRPMVFF